MRCLATGIEERFSDSDIPVERAEGDEAEEIQYLPDEDEGADDRGRFHSKAEVSL